MILNVSDSLFSVELDSVELDSFELELEWFDPVELNSLVSVDDSSAEKFVS